MSTKTTLARNRISSRIMSGWLCIFTFLARSETRIATEDAGRASAFHTVSAQLLRFVKRSVGPGEGLDHGLARPVLCHSD